METMQTPRSLFRWATATFLLLCLIFSAQASADPGKMIHYDTKYYDLYTDLDPDAAREAALR
jgi:hypothetical protein